MNREQLAHILRAASKIAGDPDILVIGSQSILASFEDTDLPPEAVGSIEVDIAFPDDPDETKMDKVDGAIGEVSPFQELYGVYAQGVVVGTATLPDGWEGRLVPFDDPSAAPSKAMCLEPHDLVISKLVAAREKDYIFARALIEAGIVETRILVERAELLSSVPIRVRVQRWLTELSEKGP